MFKTEEFDDMNEEDIVIRYMVNPVECGGHRNNTVKSWLESFGLDPEDRWYKLWTTTTMKLGDYIKKLETNKVSLPKAAFEAIWTIATELLYARYDIEKDFEPQFETNLAEMWRMINKLDTELIQPFLNGKSFSEMTG